MLSNNYKNVKGVKGMLRVQMDTLNTFKASHINTYITHVKGVKGIARARAREQKTTILIINKIYIKLSHARYKYTLNILNALHKPYAVSLSSVKGIKHTLNTLNISVNMV